VPTELAFEAFDTKSRRIKPLLKREVNNETFLTLLILQYQIYYYILVYAVYILF